MSSYDALAASYDGLMADGVYRRRADYLPRRKSIKTEKAGGWWQS